MNLVIKKDKYSIFISIAFFVLGLFMFLYPNDIVKFITYIIGVIFAVYGSIKLFTYYKSKESIGNAELTLGICSIIIGIIIMFCNGIIEMIIRFVMGGYILATGMNKLIVSLNSRSYNDKWIGLLIIGSLLIIGGLYMILKSNIVLSSIGLAIMIYSAIDIASYVLYPKNNDVIK
jgi:uncharacterized membrane protein HdeD (DUF308 family)